MRRVADGEAQAGTKRLGAAIWSLAAAAVAWTVWRGFIGANRRLDARPLVLAGWAWLHGQSPYSAETYSRLWEQLFHSPRPDAFVFAYPPSSALVLVPLALPGIDGGLLLLDLLNLVSLSVGLILCARLGGGPPPVDWRGPRCAAALALAAACGSLSAALLIGQSSLWALVAVLCLWPSAGAPRLPIVEALAVAVAAMKPSLTLPLLCFFALLRPWLVAGAAGFSLAICAAVAAATGGPGVFGEWVRAVAAYSATPANAPLELASAAQLVGRFAPGLAAWPLAMAGGLAGALVGWDARRTASDASTDEHWVAAIALAAACSPAHGYDLVLAAPLAALLPRIRPAAWPWYALGVLAVARPAPLAHFVHAVSGAEATSLERLVSAIGTAILATGAVACVALRRPLLASAQSLPLDPRSSSDKFPWRFAGPK